MSPVKVRFTRHFKREFKKFSHYQYLEIWEKIECFKQNPFEPSLRAHKLTGRLKNRWSFSINYSLRIVFIFVAEDIVDFVDIGGHEIYK